MDQEHVPKIRILASTTMPAAAGRANGLRGTAVPAGAGVGGFPPPPSANGPSIAIISNDLGLWEPNP